MTWISEQYSLDITVTVENTKVLLFIIAGILLLHCMILLLPNTSQQFPTKLEVEKVVPITPLVVRPAVDHLTRDL